MSSSQSNYNALPTKTRSLALFNVCDALYPFFTDVRTGMTREDSAPSSHYYKPLAMHVEFTFREGLWEVPATTAVVG